MLRSKRTKVVYKTADVILPPVEENINSENKNEGEVKVTTFADEPKIEQEEPQQKPEVVDVYSNETDKNEEEVSIITSEDEEEDEKGMLFKRPGGKKHNYAPSKYVGEEFDLDALKEHRKMVKRWIIGISVRFGFWFALLIPVAVLLRPYTIECEPINTFSEFSLCVILFLLLQAGIDLGLAIFSYRKVGKFLESPAVDEINILMAMKPTGGVMGNPHANTEALAASVKMGNIINVHRHKLGALNKAVKKVTNDESGSEVSSEDEESDQETLLRNRKMPTNSKTRSQLFRALKDLNKRTNQYSVKPEKVLEYSEATKGKRMSAGFKLISAMTVIPLLTILFFIIVGSSTITEIKFHLVLKGHDPNDIPTLCIATYSLNWFVLIMCVLQNLIRSAPIISHALKGIDRDIKEAYMKKAAEDDEDED
uniref:Uncharacterized protein n=1 Tax=Ostreid herpesvirus 1 TaxID=261939 RepID=V9QN76_OSHV1|nr:hypothetical protein [Ostreid herpesvirus 1]